MFEFVRNHQKLMQFFLLLIIGPLFIIGGMKIGEFGGDDTVVAKVGNKSISQQELDYALRQQDPKTYSIPGVKKMVLDRLINEDALNIEAHRARVFPNAANVGAFIVSRFPELGNTALPKDVRAKLYADVARSQNMSVPELESKVADLLVYTRTAGVIESTAFAPKVISTRIADANEQEREVQQLGFKTADFTSQVKITDDMLKSYYSKNQAQFQIPEQAKIEYVVLSVDNLAGQMSVTDDEAKAYYEKNKQHYVVDEQRRASHILIAVPKGANDTVRAAAKDKAEKLLADVRKNPADFAKLAKENSDDPGSKERGGDLDFFSKGMMVKPFQDAVDKLKVGEISDLVQSDYGYHIITLTGIKPAEIKSFDDVKAQIQAELKKQKATKKFADLRESFTNTVYEQPDSLKPVVDKLADVKLKIETANGVARTPDTALAPTVTYNNPKFLTALFADDSLKNKHNTEAIQVAEGVLIAGRVSEYKAAAQKPFEEVQAVVREAVTQAAAHDMAKAAADAKLAGLQSKDDLAGFGDIQIASRANAAKLNPSVVQLVLKADVSKLPAFVEVEVPGQGFSVVRINKVSQPASPDLARRAGLQQQVDKLLAEQEMGAYVDALKQKAKVKILRPDIVNAAPAKDGGDTN